MKRHAPSQSRPQKHGVAVLPATCRTLKSALGTPISSHGDASGIVVLLIIGIVSVALHLLQPDLVHHDGDSRRVVPVGKADTECCNRARDTISVRLQTMDHEQRLLPDHSV